MIEFFSQLGFIALLAFIQNVSFSIVSRSRNRDNVTYHLFAATASNLVWYLTFRYLVMADMSWALLPGYLIGTVSGSLFGVKVAMRIEKMLGATADGHLKSK